MSGSVIILTIVYTIIILYIFFRYNLDAKKNVEYDLYREELEISPSEAAYLVDKESDSFDFILADILTLVGKGYIEITTLEEEKERDYIFTKTQKEDTSNIKNHEMHSFRLFFNNKEEVSLKEYLAEIEEQKEAFKNLELAIPAIKSSLEMELMKQGIIDELAEKKLFKFNKLSIGLIFISLISFIIVLFANDLEILEFTTIGLLFSLLLYKTTNTKEDKITKYGVEMKSKAEGLKRYLKEYIILEDKPIYMVNILEYNYTMAVAFGLAKLSQNEFVHSTYKKIKRKNSFNTVITIIIIIAIILIEVIKVFGVLL